MNFKEIQELIKLVTKSELTEFKLKKSEFEVSIRTKNFSKETIVSSPAQVMPVQAAPVATMAPPSSASATDTPDTTTVDTSGTDLLEVKSPIVGTFYRSPTPEKPVYVRVGDDVSEGNVVCIIEAMKLFNEIESEVTGKIVKVMVEDASPVEYDQVLFLVDPKG